jgi:hypothetical protein
MVRRGLTDTLHFKKITPNKTTLSIIIKCRGILLFYYVASKKEMKSNYLSFCGYLTKIPSPDFSSRGHKKITKSNYLSLSNIWWKSKSCGHAHFHYVHKHHTKSGYRYMICLAISYSFGATALIFCRMFMHIMEVCMFTGFWFSSNILKMPGSRKL